MMRNRTWIGVLGVSAPCVILALAMNPGQEHTSSGQVHGRVTYNGCPLEGGYVLFDSDDGNPDDWAAGPIEKDGHYSVNPKWQRASHEKQRFRISVRPRNWTLTTPMPSMSEDEEPEGVRMSDSSEDLGDLRSASVEHPFPERFTNSRTSGLQVTLGHGPAHVEIELKD
jgi:hypothetical protein